MKPSYNIGARNGILEGKHMEALGSAIWLYLWFLDKQPKDSAKVLGGKPVTYTMFAQSFPNIPRIKYVRWLALIEAGSYVTLLRTPRGYVVTITKPKKWLKSDVSPAIHHTDINDAKTESDVSKPEHHESDVSPVQHHEPLSEQNLGSDVSKPIHLEDVSKMNIQYKRDSLNKQLTTNNSTIVELGNAQEPTIGDEEKAELRNKLGKLLYEVVDAYEIDVKNHNTIRSIVKKMADSKEPWKWVEYLKFLIVTYPTLRLSFKPEINTELDIYSKRKSIKSAIAREATNKQIKRSVRIR